MRFPFTVTLALAVACVGCGACVEDGAPGGGNAAPPTLVVARELRGCGTLGFVPGDRRAQIVEIPSLGGRQVFVEDINDDGVAVGGETTADGNMHAIRYTDLGGVQDLGKLNGFGSQSYASAIASDGAIGGHADRADGTAVFFGHRYTAKGGRAEICGGGCSVWDLNARGQVVGLLPVATRRPGRRSCTRRRRGCVRSGRWAGRAARRAPSASPAWWSATRSSKAHRRKSSAMRSSTTRAKRTRSCAT